MIDQISYVSVVHIYVLCLRNSRNYLRREILKDVERERGGEKQQQKITKNNSLLF